MSDTLEEKEKACLRCGYEVGLKKFNGYCPECAFDIATPLVSTQRSED